MRSSAWSLFDARDPGGDLPVGKPGRIELLVSHLHDRDPDQIAPLERHIGGDVYAGDLQCSVETDPPERAVRLLAQVATGTLVQHHRERGGPVRAEPHESETAPDVSAKHR